ncbi:MAG: type I methionyl aminopeptidase, partial [Bacteroidetes bacterium]|nr:type I methionyl aminopeptidase [Bacteroidota bacterium]
GWTVSTQDKQPSAHFEHTVAIGKEKADILTSFECIEESVKKNVELAEFEEK